MITKYLSSITTAMVPATIIDWASSEPSHLMFKKNVTWNIRKDNVITVQTKIQNSKYNTSPS